MVSVEVHSLVPESLLHRIDVAGGTLSGGVTSERHLSELSGCFADRDAYRAALEEGDPLVYSVVTASDDAAGSLSFGLGVIQPGRVGGEFYLTKGHYHSRREAAEVYIGLRGSGGLVLENESGSSCFVPMGVGEIVYVPGHTAHRSVNCGDEPFAYLGVYASDAGHDYAGIAEANFALVVMDGPDGPRALHRGDPRPEPRAPIEQEAGE